MNIQDVLELKEIKLDAEVDKTFPELEWFTWSDDINTAWRIRDIIESSSDDERDRFIGALELALDYRLAPHRVSPYVWILFLEPEDICKAAIITRRFSTEEILEFA